MNVKNIWWLFSNHRCKWTGVGPGDSGIYEVTFLYLSINVVRIQNFLYVSNELNSISIVWSITVFRIFNVITASTVSVITPLPRTVPTLYTKNALWRTSATSVGFKLAISVIKGLQSSASDHTPKGTDTKYFTRMYKEMLICKAHNPIVISR